MFIVTQVPQEKRVRAKNGTINISILKLALQIEFR
tara:strand:- start:406 stop:510 length:105 start_codon:yes stop_codon:yes gene_type:complete